MNDKPLLSNTYKMRTGNEVLFEFFESETGDVKDSMKDFTSGVVSQTAIMAFHKGKLLIVNNTEKPGTYGPISGGIEEGEYPDDTAARELKEESNMKIINLVFLGYQRCSVLNDPEESVEYQLRYYAEVKPYGPFTPDCDPDGDVTELLEVDPGEYKKYFDWSNIGEYLISRSISLNKG